MTIEISDQANQSLSQAYYLLTHACVNPFNCPCLSALGVTKALKQQHLGVLPYNLTTSTESVILATHLPIFCKAFKTAQLFLKGYETQQAWQHLITSESVQKCVYIHQSKASVAYLIILVPAQILLPPVGDDVNVWAASVIKRFFIQVISAVMITELHSTVATVELREQSGLGMVIRHQKDMLIGFVVQRKLVLCKQLPCTIGLSGPFYPRCHQPASVEPTLWFLEIVCLVS